MNNRERILKTLRGEKVDHVPWIPLCARDFFQAMPDYSERFGLEDWGKREELQFRIDFYGRIGAAFMEWGGQQYVFQVETPNVMRTEKSEGNKTFVRLETPAGELTQEFRYFPRGFTTFHHYCPVINPLIATVYQTRFLGIRNRIL